MTEDFKGLVMVQAALFDPEGQAILNFTRQHVGAADAMAEVILDADKGWRKQTRPWGQLVMTLTNLANQPPEPVE